MKTHELLELAAMDSLGMLDDNERADFENAFSAATPAVQAQVRREQLRMARFDGMLPDVEPPIGLRARVLAAVREAMTGVGRRSVAGRIGPEILPSRGVSRLWRAAAVGMAAAAIVFGFATLQMRSDFEKLASVAQADDVTRTLAENFGPRFQDRLLNPRTQFVTFQPVMSPEDGFGGKAILLVEEDGAVGGFYCTDLPTEAGSYSLVVIDKNGRERRAVLTFSPEASKFSDDCELHLSEGASVVLERRTESGESQELMRGVRHLASNS